jgi:transcriptional regulator with XRE-family HTH domain
MGTRHANVIDSLIAERVRAHRRQLGLSQSQLAEKLGVTFQQVQKYEKGTNRISAGRLFEMARLFNVPVQTLYPESEVSIERAENRTGELQAISEFVVSADGWRLCHSFLRVKYPKMRKAIIALVQEIAES